MIDIDKVNQVFDEYVSNYDMSNEMINLKYFHTYRVCEQSLNICKSLGLDEEDTRIAYLIALLHDIGRFEQERRFGTYNDQESMDHGDFGCTLLFEEALIRKFIEDNKYDEIIRKAICYHNKFSIEEDCDEKELLHSKIIRDADKIDIIYNVVELGYIRLSDDDSKISEKVKEDFCYERSVHFSHKNSRNDRIMTMFGFIFDLNFEYSYKYFKDNGFINKMFAKLKNKDIFEEYVERINEYVERKCNNVRNKVFS